VQARRQGGKVLEIHHLHKALGGQNLLTDFSYTFRKGDRIGVIGRNGVGKSTFLNLITGRLNPDAGEVLWGQTTTAGYYTQHTDDLTPGSRLIDEVKNIAEFVTLADGKQVSASKLLDMFLFPPAKQYAVVDKLSGGERRRLQLLKVLVANPNFLILDEPTNDLDIDTLNVLEQFLVDFEGCLVLVSHDRYFMDRLVDHLFVFEGEGHVRDYPGNYTSYREEAEELKLIEAEMPKAKASTTQPADEAKSDTKARKLSYKDQKELDTLQVRIPELEEKKERLSEQMTSTTDFAELQKLSASLLHIEQELDALASRWLELES
jgi:ATP-binding cassette subfamily F protein uup